MLEINTSYTMKHRRVYRQSLRQNQFTSYEFAVLSLYKFFFSQTSEVAKVKTVNWLAFTVKKKPYNRYLIFNHLLFTWFNKQLVETNWVPGAQQWRGASWNGDVAFYVLRYLYLVGRQKVYPFIPTTAWNALNPRGTALLKWKRYLDFEGTMPVIVQDYADLEFEEHYRLGYQLRTKTSALVPHWYSKVFLLRSHHYPVVYSWKSLAVLQALSLVRLKDPFILDELSTARFSMDTRKKRLLMVFKSFMKTSLRRRLIVEYPIYYRIKEQLNLTQSSAANFFQTKWLNLNQRKKAITVVKKQVFKKKNK